VALNTSQADQIGYLLRHTADVLHRQLDQTLLEQLGVSLSQLQVMTVLQHYPGAAQNQLAAHLGQTEAGVSRQLKRLAAAGLAEVATTAEEKRKHTAMLTATALSARCPLLICPTMDGGMYPVQPRAI
jgi:DNA-binding MarR family transcriptional regulator